MNVKILEKCNVSAASFLGEGGEAWVYAIDDTTVVKIYKNNDLSKDLAAYKLFYERCDFTAAALYPLKILDTGTIDNTLYSVVLRVPGIDAGKALEQERQIKNRENMLIEFYNAAKKIALLETNNPNEYSQLFIENTPHSESWEEYLDIMAGEKLDTMSPLYNSTDTLHQFSKRIKDLNYCAGPKLVHFDYFPTNTIAYDNKIHAVIDFSLAMYGDPLIDIAGAIGYLPLDNSATYEEYLLLLERMRLEYPQNIGTLTTYLIFMAIYWSGCDIECVKKWSDTILKTWQDNNCGSNDVVIWKSIAPPKPLCVYTIPSYG